MNSPADSDISHPPIPISHPRSSSRSPTQNSSVSQPPISPPRSTGVSNKSNANVLATPSSQLSPSSPTPTPTVPNTPNYTASAKMPLTPPDSSSRVMSAAAGTGYASSPAGVAAPTPNVSFASPYGNDNGGLQSNLALPAAQSESALSCASSTTADSDGLKTPNVYINGLPPNFPEEQLFTMTKEFGGVVSVRTFTRHVSDRPSGYGFVLFETVDSAERCIESLRRYRNLHPSFSKQIHKIPGTTYANLAQATSSASLSSMSTSESSDSFKARMERLKDNGSTNLYIEGLPLSIDEATLAALVAPYMIKSSRFFQTRLSHPPRIIAFVRLEHRTACEDVIERLHGRMVRGWNDPGSRISVRFADSAEQRELRRNERTGQEGEQSPARLTMAQAALLNLRGQQIPSPQFGGISASQSLPNVQHRAAENFSPPIGTRGRNPAHAGLPLHPLTAEYQRQVDTRSLPASITANLANLALGSNLSPPFSTPANLPTSISLGSNFGTRGLPPSMTGSYNVGHDASVFGGEIDISMLSRAQATNAAGFTPLEQQLLLQAQLQAQAQHGRGEGETRRGKNSFPRSTGSSHGSKLNVSGAKEFVPRGLLSRMQGGQGQETSLGNGSAYSLNSLAGLSISEAEFHAQSRHRPHPQSSKNANNVHSNNAATAGLHGSFDIAKEPTHTKTTSRDRHMSLKSDMEDARMSSTLDYSLGNRLDVPRTRGESGPTTNQAVHVRSTTLPGTFMLATGGSKSPKPTVNTATSRTDGAGDGNKSMSAAMEASGGMDSQGDSPLLISPALTYNSSSESSVSRTPSTLSPSTPFFGFSSPQHHAHEFDGPRKEEHLGASDVGRNQKDATSHSGHDHVEGENCFSVGREASVRGTAQ